MYIHVHGLTIELLAAHLVTLGAGRSVAAPPFARVAPARLHILASGVTGEGLSAGQLSLLGSASTRLDAHLEALETNRRFVRLSIVTNAIVYER